MKNNIRSIKEGHIVRRLLALIMDGAVFAFIFCALALWVFTPISNAAFDHEKLGQQGITYQVCSRLYVLEETNLDTNEKKVIDVDKLNEMGAGTTSIITLYNYNSSDVNFYKERIHYYYLCYKTGENVMYPEGKNPEDYKAPNYKELIKDDNGNLVKPSEYYTEAWFNEKFGSKTTVEDFRYCAQDAVKDFYYQPYYQEINSKLSKIELFVILPSYFLSFGIFFIMFPLIFRNGETLGKKVMHVGFVTKDGFDVKKRQIVFRQILILLFASLCTFGIGIGPTSIAILGVGVLIYVIATLISKTHRSPADYAAYTLLIDTASSVWFHDEAEEENKEVELEDKMAKYRTEKPQDKHLIQIGTEIVDEQVKKEFEEEKLKKAKNKK